MSPRAACRLEHLGFTGVYDYVAGIADWKAAGLPIEGTADHKPRVADATTSETPICGPHEPIDEVWNRIRGSGADTCIVVACDGIVVGRLHPPVWDTKGALTAAEVMEEGPSTVRPDGLLQPLIERMHQRDIAQVVVTTPQGALIGVLFRQDGERLLAGEPPTRIWKDCDGCPGRWTQ